MNLFSKITVLSLEQATVLPYLSYRLACDGCRVIRLEHPVYGDPNRLVGSPFIEGEERLNSYFTAINAGKEAITLNLGDTEGRRILARLIREVNVDIFATNQLPRNYVKLGIDYQTLANIKPDIVWMGITGFGPDSNEAAYDPVLQARGGLMELTGEPGGPPQVVGIPLPDMGTSEHCYGQVMKALFVRASTGRGSRIDMSMLESTTSWLTVPIAMTCSFGRPVSRRGNTHEFFAPVSVYPTSDGHVYISVGNDRQFQQMASLPEFAALDRNDYRTNAGRIADVANLNRAISEITVSMPTQDLLALMNKIGVAISKIQTIGEVAKDQLVERCLMKSKDPVSGYELTLAPPPTSTDFIEENGRTLAFPPRFGEHNRKIFGGELGISDRELAALKTSGVI